MTTLLDTGTHNNCCGIRHISNFMNARWEWNKEKNCEVVVHLSKEDKEKMLRDTFENRESGLVFTYGYKKGNSVLIEATLNQRQINAGWEEVLIEFGFEKVQTWKNINSGNTCAMYLLHPEKEI